MSRLRLWSLLVLSASALGLAACSSSPTTPTTAPTTPTTASPPTTAPSTVPAGPNNGPIATIPAADRSPAGTAGTAPTIKVPSGKPPTQLESADLIVGTGATAEAGDSVTAQYELATYSSGRLIQSSWTSQPIQFTLGERQVIPGWDMGLIGMQVGGRRELIVPPSLGYGASSQGPGIAANDTLVFVVDLLNIG